MVLKEGARILAIDDSSFSKEDKQALIVGVIGRNDEIEGVLSFKIDIDGRDATEKIIRKVDASRFSDQIKLIVIHGIMLAGLNIVDIIKVHDTLGIPVLALVRKKPHSSELEKAIKAARATDMKDRISLLRKINSTIKMSRIGGFYAQYVGIENEETSKLQEISVKYLRLAHIIANGIVRGESKGRI
ncbi:MAG: DUF99 family protein [Candidatus Micrarchaeales archaeon]